MMNGATLVAGIAGPLVMGIALDRRGSYDLAIWATATLALTALVMLPFMPPIKSAVEPT